MSQHTTLALNALLATDGNYQQRILVAKQHINQLSSEQQYLLRENIPLEQQQQLILSTIHYLADHVEFGETVASLFGYTLARYLYIHLDIVIPHIHRIPVYQHHNNDNNNDTMLPQSLDSTQLMNKMATVFDISIQQLYQEHGYLAIVHCLLLDPSTHGLKQRQSLMESIILVAYPHIMANITTTPNTAAPLTAKQLLDGHVTRVTAMLSVELWHPDHQFVLDALEMVKLWGGYESASLVNYLQSFMLSIMNHINQLLTDRSKQSHHALTSLVVLLDILGTKGYNFIPQLLGIAQTAMEQLSYQPQDKQNDYLDECCLFWNRLLSLAGQEESVRHFVDIIRCMVKCLALCNNNNKMKMVDELTQAIKTHALSNTTSILDHLPELPPYPELETLRQWIKDEQQEPTNNNDNTEEGLAHLIVHMSTNEIIPSFYSLQRLRRLLTQHETTLYTHELVWPLLGELYDVLLRIIKQYAYRFDISGLAASCLGLLGAIDPSRLVYGDERRDVMDRIKKKQHYTRTPTMNYTSDMIVINNYKDRSENQIFAIHLMVHYFYPTFYSSNNNNAMGGGGLTVGGGDVIQTCSQYAIQELLKAVGIRYDHIYSTTTTSTPRRRQSQYDMDIDTTRKLWHSLDQSIRDVMEPLLYSKFEANMDFTPPVPPFFYHADSFMTWTRHLCYFLLNKIKDTAPEDTSRQMLPIFQACIPSIKAGYVVLTQHLIPFLVLRVLLSSPQPERDRQLILDEMVGVLNHGAVQNDMKQSTLQLIVSITGHCRQWIRERLQQQQQQQKKRMASLRTSGTTSTQPLPEDPDVTSIKQFLAQIPHHLMAQAAFRTGNYPQALMHYELEMKDQELSKSKTKRQQGISSSSISSISNNSSSGDGSSSGGSSLSDDFLDELCQTYMHLEGPEAMSEVLSKFNREWSRPMEILRFESRGEWQFARRAYEDILPADPTLTSRYFHCLQQLGDYQHMTQYASNILETTTMDDNNKDDTKQFLKMVNRYRAEAAWKSSNWGLLHECVLSSMDGSFDASVACVLANMQKNLPLAVFLAIHHAQVALIQTLSQTNSESYQQSYDTILQFQLLHELDSVMLLTSSTDDDDDDDDDGSVMDPLPAWKIKFSMLKPSYQTKRQLLDLRLAAQFGIWKPEDDMDPNKDISDMERGLRLLLAKTARKSNDMTLALHAAYQANGGSILEKQQLQQQQLDPFATIELAKWYHERGNIHTAMQFLKHAKLKNEPKAAFLFTRYMGEQLLAKRVQPNDRQGLSKLSAESKRVEGGFTEIKRKCPDWEKLHVTSGSWEEQRCNPAELDTKFYRRAFRAIKFYCDALKVGCRYYYSTMPRLLSLWLQIVDAMRDLEEGKLKADARLSETIRIAYQNANSFVLDAADDIQPYLFALILPRLVSRLAIRDNHVARILAKIVLNVMIVYPRTTIWALQFAIHSQDDDLKSISNEILRQAETLSSDPIIPKIISQMHHFTKHLEVLAKEKCSPTSTAKLGSGQLTRHTALLNMTNLDLCIPHQRTLIPRLPEYTSSIITTTTITTHSPFPPDMPTIANILPDVQVMASLQRPKRIAFRGNNGKTYSFLCKMNDDLRKDARSMEFSTMINHFLKKDAMARQQRLYIRTYAVVPLSNKWGLIEWVDNLNPLKRIIRERWQADGMDGQHYDRLRNTMRAVETLTVDEKVVALVKEIYPNSPVVFYRWFLDLFPQPSEWYESRSRYIRTLAVMSIVGYVLGLGDRHADNIMFDATNGDTVHVDVNLLFDYGQELAVPEIVPFRLTRNLVDAMGTPKDAGLFKRSCITTLAMLREYRPQLLSVFETFLHDPITDKRRRDYGMTREQVARKEIENMSNKIQTRASTIQHVDYLIKEATSDRNLAQMYSGWTPFL